MGLVSRAEEVEPGGEFLFEYCIDTLSDQGTSRPLTGRDVLPVKQRLCKGENVIFGIAGGQDSPACKGEAEVVY